MTAPEPDPEIRAQQWVHLILKDVVRMKRDKRSSKREFVSCIHTSRSLRRNVKARLREYGIKAKDIGDGLHISW